MVGLAAIGEHLSLTERQAVAAERSTLDRIGALYMDRQASDTVFQARVTGVHRAGVFVTLDGLGITGMIPLQHLSHDRLRLDEKRQRFSGRQGHVELGALFDVSARRVNIAKGWIDFAPLPQDPSLVSSRSSASRSSSNRSSSNRSSTSLSTEGRTRPKKHPTQDRRSKKSKRPLSRSQQRSRKT
jgi:ribonuclease R